MRKAIIFGLVVAALFLIACTTQINSRPLSEGEKLFRSKCASCHRLPDPVSRDAKQWEDVLAKHEKRARLTPEAKRLILTHLQGAEN
ncbi:MAG: hypothetical protein GXO77_06095 [Calditrichaeota bacterium]|nr:hypothetical protein [Calditrichota bacterium]